MTDPKRSPIAALLPKWKEWSDNLERDARTIAISRSLNTPDCECEDWRENELGCQAVRLRQCMRELEAAIAAQVEVFERTLPDYQWPRYGHSATQATELCIQLLKGEP